MEKNNVRAMNRTKRNMRTKRNLSRVKEYAPQGLVAFMVLAALMLMLFIFLKLPVIGAFIIGICESIIKGLDTILIVNGAITEQIGLATFSDAFTFVLLIIILVFKPTGLFGEKTTDKV